MKVYRLRADSEDYQTLTVDKEDLDRLWLDGTPRRDTWISAKVRRYVYEAELDDLKPSDFPSLVTPAGVFSRQAVEGLRDLLEPNGEILPLLCDEGDYVLFNVLTLTDALDEEHSEIDRDEDGRISAIHAYHFIPDRLGNAAIFKLIQIPDLGTFVTDEFVERVQELGFVGFDFTLVWDEQTGPVIRKPVAPPPREKKPPLKRPPRQGPRPDLTAMFGGIPEDEELLGLIDESGLPQAEQVKALLRPSVRFYATRMEDDEIAVARSKLGGAPDLGPGLSWPLMEGEPLAFLAQVNLAEVSELGLKNPLPPEGMLYFFHAEPKKHIVGLYPEEKDGFRVLFHPGPIDELTRVLIPAELPKRGRYRPCLLEGEAQWTMPPLDSEQIDALGLSTEERDSYFDLDQEVAEYLNCCGHRLFGYPDQIQGSPAADCETGSTGADYSPEVHEEALHWLLLMQINTDEPAGMVWGDNGCLYFCIRDEDLLSLAFENAWMVMQCT